MIRPRLVGCCRTNAASGGENPFQRPTGLTLTFTTRDCRVWFAGREADYQISADTLLIGQAYQFSPGYPRIGSDTTTGQAPPLGEDRCWGDYLLITQDDDKLRVYRSAMGRLPCYVVAIDGWTLFSSDIDLLEQACGLRFAPDWDAIAHHLCHPHLRVARTCLTGVTELFGGQALTIGPTGDTIASEWTPWPHRGTRPATLGNEDLADRIRSVTLQTVGRLAEPYGNVVLGVSGGLDSSIVAAALINAGIHVTLVTIASRDPRGDERHYARILAKGLGLPLIERDEDIDLVDPFVSQSTHLPRPIGRSFSQSTDALLSAVARQEKADCHFNGAGGDNVFCYLQSAAPVADLLKRGDLFHALRCASDIGKLTGAGMWKALRLGARRTFFRSPSYRWPVEPRYLEPETITRSRHIASHPWLKAPPGAMPGTASHIAAILAIENHLEGFARELTLPVISPLVARPMVEAAIDIPAWRWCAGGQNRVVARAAFADMLPSEIIERRSKGTPDGVAAAVFERHHRQIGAFLCEGLLASNAIIDREAIASACARDGPVRGYDYIRLLSLCDVEAWVRGIDSRARNHGRLQRTMPRLQQLAPGGV